MNLKPFLYGLSLSLAASSATAEMIDVKISNLTNGMYFTPVLVAAHDSSASLYKLGMEATPQLAMMAEGGQISGLSTLVKDAGGVVSEDPASGMLAPGAYAMAMDIDTGDNKYLSITAMLLPTNDGFVGLDSWHIPETAGTYTIYLNGYDAGSEANNELLKDGSGAPGMPGIPGNPGMNNGTGGTGVAATETNEMVHVHRGVLGDTDAAGGTSDLDSRIHRWLNPVAKVVVTVK